jgi:hypothetical protein
MRLYLFIFAEQTAISTPDQLTRLNMLERQQQATRYLTYGNYLLTYRIALGLSAWAL